MTSTLHPYCKWFLLAIFFIFYNCDSSSPTLPTPVEEEMPAVPPTSTPSTFEKSSIAFYNVENLFDTIDDPDNASDNEFLPTAAKAWTIDRYDHKLNNIGKVIQGMNYPILLGLAEVENRKVLEDLVNSERLVNQSYQIIHEESPDHRGIDVALLFQTDQFEVEDWTTHSVQIDDPNINNFTTRDILRVKGLLRNTPTYLFINHWPSRSGGTEQTEFRRITVATRLNELVESTMTNDPSAHIIIMGDFNDEPTNKSLLDVLGAQTDSMNLASSRLYNLTGPLDAIGEGTFNFQGNWQMLDQIIISSNLLASNTAFRIGNFQVYKAEDLFFTHPEYGLSPDRTYGGDNYFGGFSDHLPVFVEIE